MVRKFGYLGRDQACQRNYASYDLNLKFSVLSITHLCFHSTLSSELRINNDATSCLSIKSKLQTDKNTVRNLIFFTFIIKCLLFTNVRYGNESLYCDLKFCLDFETSPVPLCYRGGFRGWQWFRWVLLCWTGKFRWVIRYIYVHNISVCGICAVLL